MHIREKTHQIGYIYNLRSCNKWSPYCAHLYTIPLLTLSFVLSHHFTVLCLTAACVGYSALQRGSPCYGNLPNIIPSPLTVRGDHAWACLREGVIGCYRLAATCCCYRFRVWCNPGKVCLVHLNTLHSCANIPRPLHPNKSYPGLSFFSPLSLYMGLSILPAKRACTDYITSEIRSFACVNKHFLS